MGAFVSGILKTIFGVIALFVGAVLLVTLGVSWADGMDGVVLSTLPILVVLTAIGAGLLWIGRRRRQAKAGADPSPKPSAEERIEGLGATITLRRDGITITRHGGASFLTHGLKGEKRIAFASITALQLKEPGRRMSGYLQFSILGGVESRRGIWDATLDENTVMYAAEQADAFLRLRDRIEAEMAATRLPAAANGSVADEISKMAALHDRGILSDAEFALQKASLLARTG